MAYIITWGYIAGRELLGILAYRGRPSISPPRVRVCTKLVHCHLGRRAHAPTWCTGYPPARYVSKRQHTYAPAWLSE